MIPVKVHMPGQGGTGVDGGGGAECADETM